MDKATRPIPVPTGVARPSTRRREVAFEGLTWIDLPQPVSADMTFLRERFRFDLLALEDVLSPLQRPKLDVYGAQDYLFLVVHVPTLDREQHVVVSKVDIFAGRDFVVSTHDGSLKPLRRLFAAVSGDESVRKQIMARGPGYIVYRILDALVKQGFPVVSHVEETIEQLQDQVINQNLAQSLQTHIFVSRDVIRLRHMLQSNIVVFDDLRSLELPFLRIDTSRFFGDTADGAHKLAMLVEEQRETMVALGGALATSTVCQQSRVQGLLLLALLALAPLVALAAIAALALVAPPTGQPIVFAAALLLALGIGGGLVGYGRSQRWF